MMFASSMTQAATRSLPETASHLPNLGAWKMARLTTDKYVRLQDTENRREGKSGTLLTPISALLTGDETIAVFALLALAIGLAGIAILFLFAKKKI
jgi:LPXTG-motif cell wall-anchored protein